MPAGTSRNHRPASCHFVIFFGLSCWASSFLIAGASKVERAKFSVNRTVFAMCRGRLCEIHPKCRRCPVHAEQKSSASPSRRSAEAQTQTTSSMCLCLVRDDAGCLVACTLGQLEVGHSCTLQQAAHCLKSMPWHLHNKIGSMAGAEAPFIAHLWMNVTRETTGRHLRFCKIVREQCRSCC